MPPSEPVESITGWEDESLLRTAQINQTVGANADMPDPVRFQAAVTSLIRKRLASPDPDALPAVFLLEPLPPDVISTEAIRTIPILDNGLTPVAGRLWFVGPVVASGKSVDIEDWDDAAVFDLVVEKLGLGMVPAMFFDSRPTTPEARFYPNGLGDPDLRELKRIGSGAISADAIFTTIDDIWRTSLASPGVQERPVKLWENATKHRPVSEAELLVQALLKVGLVSKFGCSVRAEQPQATGRLDLVIEEVDWSDPTVVTVHAILELKVLRSFWSGTDGSAVTDAETLKWIADGVTQAHSYRSERPARTVALCCFDMRKSPNGQACFDHVLDQASERDILLRVWPIFSTARAMREGIKSGISASS